MEKKNLLLLVKVFGQEEHADKFIHEGTMKCQTIKQFKQTKNDYQGDPFEAVCDWHQPEDVEITITATTPDGVSTSRTLTELAGPVVHQAHIHDGVNAYCMYAICSPDFNETFNNEEERLEAVKKVNSMLKLSSEVTDGMLSFGEHAVIITRVSKFIEKVKETAKANGYDSWSSLVNYFDPATFSGSFGEVDALFQKRESYDYQREFRFAFFREQSDGEMFLNLGSLEEFGPIKLKTSEINKVLEIRLDESKSKELLHSSR